MMRTRGMEPLRAGQSWLDQERPIRPALRALLARLGRRGRASWFVWVPLAVAATALVTVRAARRRIFEATVVLRVTEGEMHVAGSELNSSLLYDYVRERAFTNENLAEVVARYPGEFSGEPAVEATEMRSATDLAITDNDFVEDRAAEDPPRSARIAVTFHDLDPETALAVARDLAELIVRSTLNLQKQAAEREAAGSALALRQAEGALAAREDEQEKADSGSSHFDPILEQARGRLDAMVAMAADARLAKSADRHRQTLAFDLVDAGRLPQPPSSTAVAAGVAGRLVVGFLAGLLLAGAFDPRVLDRDDVVELGLVPLGRTPRLPRLPPAAASEAVAGNG
jgi:hypothetical protein